jgi:hypothetical protein
MFASYHHKQNQGGNIKQKVNEAVNCVSGLKQAISVAKHLNFEH